MARKVTQKMYAAGGRAISEGAAVEEALREVIVSLLGTGLAWTLVAGKTGRP